MASRCRLSAARISSEPGTLQRCELQTHHHGQFRKISFGSPGRDHPIDCLLRVRATLSLDQGRCKGFCRLGCGKADRTRCRTDFRGGEKRNYASWPSKSRPDFEIVRPLARHVGPETAADGRARHSAQLLSMFANMAIHHLVQASDPELVAWFERAAQPSPIRLRRPS
jgi:hypothetical protein